MSTSGKIVRQICHRCALIVALTLLAGCSGRAVEATSLLAAFAGIGESRPPIERQSIDYQVEGRDNRGDLYRRLDTPPLAGLVLAPGVTPDGLDDPRLIEFAALLARARLLVLVPEIEGARRLEISAEDSLPIRDAVLHLASDSEVAGPVGLAGISYAAGPAFLTALDPEAREHLGFIFSIGGYKSTQAILTYFTTGAYREPDHAEWRYGQPDRRAKWLFLQANLHRVEDPDERDLLRRLAERRMFDETAEIDDILSALGPNGRSIADLLTNQDPDEVDRLIAALPSPLRTDLDALDLAMRDLSVIDLPVVLLHGRDDPVIPFTESLALQRALPPGRGELFLTDGLMHVDMDSSQPADVLRLHRLTRRLLALRDDLAAARGAR